MTVFAPPAGLPAAQYPAAAATPAQLPEDVAGIVSDWTARFNHASEIRDHNSLQSIFFDESYWRDHLMSSWDLRTIHGPKAIADFLDDARKDGLGHSLQLMVDVTVAPEQRPRNAAIDKLGRLTGLVAFLRVESSLGRGRGYVRLLFDTSDGHWKAFTVFCSLGEIHGHPERIKHARPPGPRLRRVDSIINTSNDHEFECAVLIVGAGQAGLTTAARLSRLGISNIVVDIKPRVGDNWRDRYEGLVLHDPVWYNHLPYMPFPESWPVFTSKDKLANWFELYTQALDLTVWTSTKVQSAEWNGKAWRVVLSRGSSGNSPETCILTPRHIVQATGHSGEMHIPRIDGIESFQGSEICHSSSFKGIKDCSTGKKVVVIGSGNSAHDIAHRCCLNGLEVTMVQRSSTCVDPTEYSKGKDLYKEDGPRTEDADLATYSLPNAVSKRHQMEGTDKLYKDHSAFFEGLHKAGFVTDRGPGGAGRKLKFLEQGGGYYIDVGASSLIIDGYIKIKQGVEVCRIEPHAVALSDGSKLPADHVIFATGFKSMRETARSIFGDEVADKLGPVWGLDVEGELKSVWRRSGHPGFWFAGGNLAIARYYSRLLALQIMACEIGTQEK